MADTRAALQAVGHPVRLRVLERLANRRTASVSELAEAAGVHENTVRVHVAVLEDAGLLSSEARPVSGPGRPGVQYRLTPEGERLDDDFLGLAELLAAVVGRAGMSSAQLREVGREWGRYLAGRPGRYDMRVRVPEILGKLGFDATAEDDRVRLTGCPCPTIAPDRPELICELATGVVDGVLGAVGAPQRVGGGEHDPARRDCRITLVDVSAPRRA
jgi:predicted ArsR family transcriptional regulator